MRRLIHSSGGRQRGAFMIITMSILLVSSTLTVAFFYFQNAEIDLLAYETDNIQAFYLASAGLARIEDRISGFLHDPNLLQNPDRLFQNPNQIINHIETTNLQFNMPWASNRQWTAAVSNRPVPVIQNQSITFLVDVTGTVTWQAAPGTPIKTRSRIIEQGFLIAMQGSGVVEVGDVLTVYLKADFLNDKNNLPIILSYINKKNAKNKIVAPGIDTDPNNYRPLNAEDMIKYAELKDNVRTGLDIKRRIDDNNNRLIFYLEQDQVRKTYEIWKKDFDSAKLGVLWKYPDFEYKDSRETEVDNKGISHTIIKPTMTVKEGKKVTLQEGTYYFDTLTLEKNSILQTSGDVKIYLTKLELKESATMVGGSAANMQPIQLQVFSGNPTEPSVYDPEVVIGSSSLFGGHIMAPDGNITIRQGTVANTRIYGSLKAGALSFIKIPQIDKFTINIEYSDVPSGLGTPIGAPRSLEVNKVDGTWREVRGPYNGIL